MFLSDLSKINNLDKNNDLTTPYLVIMTWQVGVIQPLSDDDDDKA